MPPPVPGNDTSEDYSDYQDNTPNDDVSPQIPNDPRFVVENRARGAVPVQARPPRPTSSAQITTTEEPSQNRGQDLRQPVTPRPRARTPAPPVPAARPSAARLAPTSRPAPNARPVPVPATRPVEAPRSFAASPQPRPNTLDAFSAFQTPFDFPRSRIEDIERNRPGREPTDPVAPAAPVAQPARPARPARPVIEEITTRRPIRIQAARQPEQQSFIPRQQSQPSFIPRQLQRGQRPPTEVQEVTEVPEVQTTRRPTRPLNFDPRRQRPSAAAAVAAAAPVSRPVNNDVACAFLR